MYGTHLILMKTVFSPAKIEGVREGIILGGASVHIKDFGSTPIPLQRQINTEGMGAPYPLSMLGRTLENTVTQSFLAQTFCELWYVYTCMCVCVHCMCVLA